MNYTYTLDLFYEYHEEKLEQYVMVRPYKNYNLTKLGTLILSNSPRIQKQEHEVHIF